MIFDFVVSLLSAVFKMDALAHSGKILLIPVLLINRDLILYDVKNYFCQLNKKIFTTNFPHINLWSCVPVIYTGVIMTDESSLTPSQILS